MLLLSIITVLLVVYILILMVAAWVVINDEGPIIPEKIVDEYLNKVKDQCEYHDTGYFHKLDCGYNNPSIYKSGPTFITFLVPYYINGLV
jgi:protein gp37